MQKSRTLNETSRSADGNTAIIENVIAIASFQGQKEGDLAFRKGDVIAVLDKPYGPGGWWIGRLNGRVGNVPSNFVKPCSGAQSLKRLTSPAQNAAPSSPSTTASVVRQSPARTLGTTPSPTVVPVTSTTEPSISPMYSPPLSQSTISATESSATTSRPPLLPPKANTSSKPPLKPPVGQAKVLFGYVSNHCDELSLSSGDVVSMIETTTGEAGWWKVRFGGKTGLFPKTFLQVIKLYETKTSNDSHSSLVNSAGNQTEEDGEVSAATQNLQMLTPQPIEISNVPEKLLDRNIIWSIIQNILEGDEEVTDVKVSAERICAVVNLNSPSASERLIRKQTLKHREGQMQLKAWDDETATDEQTWDDPRDSSQNTRSKRCTSSEIYELTVGCSVCLDNINEILSSGRELKSTKCHHVFCSQCIGLAIEIASLSQMQRKPTTKRHLASFLLMRHQRH